MPAIHIPKGEQHVKGVCNKWCNHSFAGWLVSVAPDVLWYDVQDVGYYQGMVFGVGQYKGFILLFHSYYGSCSWCGAWGEGGEPQTQDDVIGNSVVYEDPAEAIEFVRKSWTEMYETPDLDLIEQAIKEVHQDLSVLRKVN